MTRLQNKIESKIKILGLIKRVAVGLKRVAGDVPEVVVWGACDDTHRTMPEYLKDYAIPHSTRNKINLVEPILQIVRQLMADPNLQFVEAPPIVPPTITIESIKSKV